MVLFHHVVILMSYEMKNQLIVMFNTCMKHDQQREHLLAHYPPDSFSFVMKNYVSENVPSDFVVIRTFLTSQEWFNSASRTSTIVTGVYEDNLGISRRVLNENDDNDNDDEDVLESFDPAQLSLSFTEAGIKGRGVKVAVFDTGMCASS